MKKSHPEDYQALCEIPVTFHYVNDGHHMHYRRPTIVNDHHQEGGSWGMHVNYAPPFQGPLDIDDPKEATRFYKAFQTFADIVEDEKLRFELTLKPGQLGKSEFCVVASDIATTNLKQSFSPIVAYYTDVPSLTQQAAIDI